MVKFYNSQNMEIRGVNFGRVRLGEAAQMSLFAKNEGRFLLIDLEFSVDNPEVGILASPKNLRPGESGPVSLKWNPRVDSEFGLNCKITWKGDELRGEM